MTEAGAGPCQITTQGTMTRTASAYQTQPGSENTLFTKITGLVLQFTFLNTSYARIAAGNASIYCRQQTAAASDRKPTQCHLRK
ncbi:hypothetical protein D3C87_1663980 [compost metagenome]